MSHTTEQMDVYQAESIMKNIMASGETHYAINNKIFQLPNNIRFVNTSELKAFFNVVSISPYVIMHYGVVPAPKLIVSNQLIKKSYYRPQDSTIHVSQQDYFTDKMTVLHEYAHHIVYITKMNNVHPHDEVFLQVYTQLLNDFIGNNFGDILRELVTK